MKDVRFHFQDLLVYQEATDLSLFIFRITKLWPPEYRYSLTDQIQRAALSISLNIAEGSSRTGKDFKHFLSVARGSCYECVPLIAIANKLAIITDSHKDELLDKLNHIARMLTSLRSKLT